MKTAPLPRTGLSTYDAIVIGGGVNGTAALRELAQAGYRVILAEADDLASGASGKSSRMLHCGLRYLETPEPVRDAIRHPMRFARALGMARDAMQARAELATDPTVATRPIELSFPVWRNGPFRRWQLDLGLRLLGMIGPKELPLDREIRGADAAQSHPIGRHLRDPEDLVGLVSFREYLFVSPERICIDNALDAEVAGAELRLRTRAEVGERTDDGLWRVTLEDETGTTDILARTVLNMAGPWADDIGRFGKRLIRGTKGAHIIIRLPEGYADRGIATLHRGGQPFYGLPLGKDRFYFGPTETPFEGNARDIHADKDDLDFLLAEANYLLPGLKLRQRDVEQCWAGIRPLTDDPDRPMGARERTVHDLAAQGFENVLAMTAGPVMSQRSAGRRMLAEVRARIGAPQMPQRQTDRPRSPGNVDPAIQAVTHEHAPDLYGVLAARTGAVWQAPVTRADAEQTAQKLAPLFGWDEVRVTQQVGIFLERQNRVFQVPHE